MKVLVSSCFLPPLRGGSVFIVDKLIRNFRRDEMVVVGGRPLLEDPPKRTTDEPKVLTFRTQFDIGGHGARFFTPLRLACFPWLLYRMDKAFREEDCDAVLAVFPDPYYCFAGYLVAKKNGAPLSCYLHNTYKENKRRFAKFASWFQPRLFDSSDRIFVMSEGMRRYYERSYGEHRGKFVPLVHTFTAYPEGIEAFDTTRERKVWRLAMMGNFNDSNIEATRRFVDAVKDDPRFEISIYTNVAKVMLKQRGIDVDKLDYRGFVADADLPATLAQHDMMVLTHGFTGGYGEVEYQTIFPTRTIPMLLSKRPIFVHSPPKSFLSDFVREHGCGELVEEPTTEAVLAGLERIMNSADRQRELVQRSEETVGMFYGPNVARAFKQELAAARGDAAPVTVSSATELAGEAR